MKNKNEIGFVDWEFIHDMQNIVPNLITPELIRLSKDFLNKIPKKWSKIKKKLAEHVSKTQTVYVAISDVENLGNEFKIRGTFQNKEGEPLDFYRVVVFDKDKFEDDYIGAVITDGKGGFTLSFGKKTFSDFGMELEPDIYFKVYDFIEGKFHKHSQIMPEVREKTETIEGKIIFEFGVIII
jgi:hypothetical protein